MYTCNTLGETYKCTDIKKSNNLLNLHYFKPRFGQHHQQYVTHEIGYLICHLIDNLTIECAY